MEGFQLSVSPDGTYFVARRFLRFSKWLNPFFFKFLLSVSLPTLAVCSQPCMNGGKCISPNKCRCRPPFSGPRCEQKKNVSLVWPCCSGQRSVRPNQGPNQGPLFVFLFAIYSLLKKHVLIWLYKHDIYWTVIKTRWTNETESVFFLNFATCDWYQRNVVSTEHNSALTETWSLL